MTTFYALHNSPGQDTTQFPELLPLRTVPGKTRVVKELLSVGVQPTASGDWNVTPDVLKTLANDFAAMKAASIDSNLCWGARPDGGPLGQHGVTAEHDIGPFEQVFVSGDKLYGTCYCANDDYEKLTKIDRKVSVGVKPNWTSAGKTFALALLHAVVCLQPVVNEQGPFLTLSNESQEDEMTPEQFAAAIKPFADTNKTLAEGFITLSNEFKTFKAEQETKKANAAKDAWGVKLKTLFDGKKIDAATLTTYEGLGTTVGFNLAILAPLDNLLMLASESGVQTLADGKGPDLEGQAKPESDDVVAARLKARGVDVSLMPKLG